MIWLAALVGAIAGAVVSYLLRILEALTQDKANAITEHISEIERIRDLAVDYWLHDPKEDKTKELRLAVLVRGALFASAAFEKHADNILRHKRNEYSELIYELEDASTGEDFESRSREVRPEQAVLVMKAASNLIAFLYSRRRSVFFAH